MAQPRIHLFSDRRVQSCMALRVSRCARGPGSAYECSLGSDPGSYFPSLHGSRYWQQVWAARSPVLWRSGWQDPYWEFHALEQMAAEATRNANAKIAVAEFDFDQYNADRQKSSDHGSSVCAFAEASLMMLFLDKGPGCLRRSAPEWREFLVTCQAEFDANRAQADGAGLFPITALKNQAEKINIPLHCWEPPAVRCVGGEDYCERVIEGAESLATELQGFDNTAPRPWVCMATVFTDGGSSGNSFGIYKESGPLVTCVDTHRREDFDGSRLGMVVATSCGPGYSNLATWIVDSLVGKMRNGAGRRYH